MQQHTETIMNIDEGAIVFLILLFSWAEYLWELYLSLRQLKIYKTNNTIPDDLKDMLNEESFKKARLYGIDKSQFRIVKEFYSIVLTSVILYKRWIAVAWVDAETLSRKFEFEADNFAVSLNYPQELRSALIKLGKDNLDYPIYDKLYSAWYHSHPSLLHRIENIRTQTANTKKD
ncbi:hypothetical protein MSG28_009782 [Choristoneura fumiferana]|uniref:Uncharacterized protein n=1 Tax=Choristoneura fumiferana TaxID=7141 RepID=A0ACC0JCG6_CHOFU|nr:hypothetical protein MSG28_009782 [Choristoneura fumiferana]